MSEDQVADRTQDVITKGQSVLDRGTAVEPMAPSFVPDGEMITSEGQVVLDEAGVGGVEVIARATLDSGLAVIGHAISDGNGHFQLHPRNEQEARAARLASCMEAPVQVAALDAQRELATADVADGSPLVLSLPADSAEHGSDWRAIAELAADANLVRVGDLASELRSLSPRGVFRGLPVTERLAAYDHLTRTFDNDTADATRGLLDYFGAVEALPLTIDPVALREGHLEKALFKDIASAGAAFKPGLWPWIDWAPDTSAGVDPLVGYRDYLLKILVDYQMSHMVQHDPLSLSSYVERVENRFHQDFRTRDTARVAAAEVLIPIVEAILTAPTGPGYGIGLAAAIPPRAGKPGKARLEELVALTGLPRRLVENRWRIALDVGDDDGLSPVEQNIRTLQRAMTDTFQQDEAEPWPVAPALTTADFPLLSDPSRDVNALNVDHLHFLRFEEWLRQREPKFFENLFDIRKTMRLTVSDAVRQKLAGQMSLQQRCGEKSYIFTNSAADQLQYARCVLDAYDLFRKGDESFFELRYEEAIRTWEELSRLLARMVGVARFDYQLQLKEKRRLRAFSIKSEADLAKYEDLTTLYFAVQSTGSGTPVITDWNASLEYWGSRLFWLQTRVLPVVLAEAYLKLGAFERALGRSDSTSPLGKLWELARFAIATNSVNGDGPVPSWVQGPLFVSSATYCGRPRDEYRDGSPNPVERAFYRLKLGEILLAWADSDYRSDEPERIQRAREAYKAVIYLHGDDPGLDPEWSTDPIGRMMGKSSGAFPLIGRAAANPAVTSQVKRGRVGFLQIEAGLNFYGATEAYVPPLRYRTLAQAAERFAVAAKSTQNDFLRYVASFEQGIADEMNARAAVKKAQAAVAIAGEEREIAQYAVGQVQAQIDGLKAQAAAKRKEYEENDNAWSQLKESVKSIAGAKDDFEGLAKPVIKEFQGDYGAAGTVGLTDIGKAAMSKNALSGMGGTLGAGLGATAAIGLFVYKGVQGLESWVEGQNKRKAEYEQIEKVAIPAAEKVKALKEREVKIADLRAQIAQADADLGRDLLRFYSARVLNKGFWLSLANLSSSILDRYIDLGARHAWLAERALAFAIGRAVRVVSLDYTNRRMRNVGGADRMQLHLAELEATRLSAASASIPIKHSISLSSYAPAAFAALRATGRCGFATWARDVTRLHPGSYGLRIRAVSVTLKLSQLGAPPRGVLTNGGVSLVVDENGATRRLARYPDAIALSEFVLRDDMAVYSLPDETLLPFEGSGLDTNWWLEFPLLENDTPPSAILDVILTFDLQAQYSAKLNQTMRGAAPAGVRRALLVSIGSLYGDALGNLANGTADLAVDIDAKTLFAQSSATARKLGGVATVVQGTSEDVTMDLTIGTKTANVKTVSGAAASSVGPMSGAQPLDALIGESLMLPIKLRITRAANPAGLNGLSDLLIALEFEETR